VVLKKEVNTLMADGAQGGSNLCVAARLIPLVAEKLT
jgi:hypothetical protein